MILIKVTQVSKQKKKVENRAVNNIICGVSLMRFGVLDPEPDLKKETKQKKKKKKKREETFQEGAKKG